MQIFLAYVNHELHDDLTPSATPRGPCLQDSPPSAAAPHPWRAVLVQMCHLYIGLT